MKSFFSPSFHELVADGDAARDRGAWADAAIAYERALQVDDRQAGIWVQLGHALKESGRLAEAEKSYRRSLAIDGENPDTYLQLGHVLKLQGRMTVAVDAYVTALRLDPRFEHARHELRQAGWNSQDLADIVRNDDAPRTTAGAASAAAARAASDVARKARPLPADAGGYADAFADVRLLVTLGLIASPEMHYAHYGYRQGRDVLMSLAKTPPSRIFVLCPSFFKRCGIGEHTRYLAQCIEAAGFETQRIRTTRDLKRFTDDQLRDGVIIVNHGPGLFDGYNPELSEGETTIDLLSTLGAQFKRVNLRPILFMHSLLDRDNEVMFPRQQLALEYPIPVVTTIEAAARVFNIFRVEHGMQPMQVPPEPARPQRHRDYPTIGFFGFPQWGGKNFDALFNVTKTLKGKLVGSIATGNAEDIKQLTAQMTQMGIRCNVGTGWVEDTELASRLVEADYHYLPQHDYDHWNNSGTARFVMNFHKPVMLPPHNPFLDLRDYAIFAEDHDLPALMAHMRDDAVYASACARSRAYAEAHPMLKEMPRLAAELHVIAGESGARNFITPNMTCAFALMGVTAGVFEARVRHAAPDVEPPVAGEPDTPERLAAIETLRARSAQVAQQTYPAVEDIKYWRDHYELEELFYPTAFETFVNAFRAMLKREPNFVDRALAARVMHTRILPGPAVSLRQMCDLVASLLGKRVDLDFTQPVQVYYRGEPVTRKMLADPSLINALGARLQERLRLCSVLKPADSFNPAGADHHNLATMLTYPADWFAKAAGAAAAAAGLVADFALAAAKSSAMERLSATAAIIGEAGGRMSDVFVLDAPCVEAINPSRQLYCTAELWLLDGDAFLVNAFRAVMKRDPSAVEMFSLEEQLRQSKSDALAAIAKTDFANARIIDVDTHSPDVNDELARELDPILRQFRSPFAGGWNQRNAYLEAKRHYSRFWLKNKQQKDVWWQQAGQNVESIRG